MKLFGLEVERSYWLLTIGIVLGVYMWFFFMAISRFVDIKNEKIAKNNEEDLQSIKEQVAIIQRFKAENIVFSNENALALPDGLTQIYTTHFTVYSLNESSLKEVGLLSEKIYDSTIADTNLYNFNLPERFSIYIYDNSKTYKKYTKRPEWSSGFAVNRKIYTYEGNHLCSTLSHEISHLIFNDFMGNKAENVSRWINEGLAMYEEHKMNTAPKTQFDKSKRIAMNDFLAFDFSTTDVEKVKIWYLQAESLISFMIDSRAKEKFYNFLTKLRETENIDESLFWGYQSEFKNMTDLESVWLATE